MQPVASCYTDYLIQLKYFVDVSMYSFDKSVSQEGLVYVVVSENVTAAGETLFRQFYNCIGRALAFAQPVTEMSTRSRKNKVSGNKKRPAHTADNLTSICEPILLTMWDQ
jgi:hypothetical protein